MPPGREKSRRGGEGREEGEMGWPGESPGGVCSACSFTAPQRRMPSVGAPLPRG